MPMFDNYENLSPSYIPNNQKVEIQSRIEFNNKEPKKEFSKNGEFIGYSWYYGDTVNIPYNVNKSVFVEKDAIVYSVQGETPNSETEGKLGQKAYNIIDLKLWTCETLDQNIYTWKEQRHFSYPKHGEKEIILDSGIDMSNKTIEITIKNFRKEVVYSTKFEHKCSITVPIDKELSDKLIKGLYYMTFSIVDETSHYSDESLLLLIKDIDKSYEIADDSVVRESTLEEIIEEIVRDIFGNLFDDEFSFTSTNGLQNKVITEKIFGENGIDNNIETLFNNINELLSFLPDDVSIENKLVSKQYVDDAIGGHIPVIKTSDLINDGDDGIHPFITDQSLEGYATDEYVNTELAEKADISDIPDLTGYATEEWVNDNAITLESTALADVVTSSNALSQISSDDKVITPGGVNTIIDRFVGNLTNLETSDKTNVVRAINELEENKLNSEDYTTIPLFESEDIGIDLPDDMAITPKASEVLINEIVKTSAPNIIFDNTGTNLLATDVQGAISELDARMPDINIGTTDDFEINDNTLATTAVAKLLAETLDKELIVDGVAYHNVTDCLEALINYITNNQNS